MMDVISAAAILWNTWNEFEMIELDKDTQSFFSLLWKMFHSVCPVPPLMPRSWVEEVQTSSLTLAISELLKKSSHKRLMHICN